MQGIWSLEISDYIQVGIYESIWKDTFNLPYV